MSLKVSKTHLFCLKVPCVKIEVKISIRAGVVGQGLYVRDGRVWALHLKWLLSFPQKNKTEQ